MFVVPPILQLLRPADWVKNVFVLPALVFSLPRMVQDGAEIVPALWATLAAVAGFCATASGFYAINDALDAKIDRQHPVKCRRPIASGAISVRTGLVMGVVLFVVVVLRAMIVIFLLCDERVCGVSALIFRRSTRRIGCLLV